MFDAQGAIGFLNFRPAPAQREKFFDNLSLSRALCGLDLSSARICAIPGEICRSLTSSLTPDRSLLI